MLLYTDTTPHQHTPQPCHGAGKQKKKTWPWLNSSNGGLSLWAFWENAWDRKSFTAGDESERKVGHHPIEDGWHHLGWDEDTCPGEFLSQQTSDGDSSRGLLWWLSSSMAKLWPTDAACGFVEGDAGRLGTACWGDWVSKVWVWCWQVWIQQFQSVWRREGHRDQCVGLFCCPACEPLTPSGLRALLCL